MKKKILLLSLLCLMGSAQAKKLFVTCSVHGNPAKVLGLIYQGGDIKFEMAPKKMTVNGLPTYKYSASSVIWNATPTGAYKQWFKYNSNTNQLFFWMPSKKGGHAFVEIDPQCEDSGRTRDLAAVKARKQERLESKAANPDGGSDVIDSEKPPTN